MLIFFKPRLVLFAVEKTATSALQQALKDEADVKLLGIDPVVGKHISFQDYKRHVEPAILTKVTLPLDYVGVIREPVSWLHSWHRYRQRDKDVGTPQSTRGISFDQFVRAFCSTAPAPYARMTSQAARICTAAGQVGMTHLFRYEELDKLICFLADRLGHEIAVQKVNVSPKVEETALSPEPLALLRETHAKDFAIYESLLPPQAVDAH